MRRHLKIKQGQVNTCVMVKFLPLKELYLYFSGSEKTRHNQCVCSYGDRVTQVTQINLIIMSQTP